MLCIGNLVIPRDFALAKPGYADPLLLTPTRKPRRQGAQYTLQGPPPWGLIPDPLK